MKKFKELGLKEEVLKAVDALGYELPSKIQEEIIPLIMEGNDVIGKAQTGTGKTMAFAASVLSKIDPENKSVQVLVLAPTRELAVQVSEEFNKLSKFNKLNVLAVYGGFSIEKQMSALKKGVQVVVGTPGRIMDLLKRKTLKLDNLDYFILDEADEMLNMGFIDDIECIFKQTSEEKQVLLFSATMPKPIERLASRYMKKDYKFIEIKENSRTSINVEQNYYLVNNRTRGEVMYRVLDANNFKLGIIFCQTKKECDELLGEMQGRGYSVEVMHGDISQSMRSQTLKRFKAGSFNYLIATDVAARGIHVDDIDVVINYNLPQDIESYIHRIGRTGRAGNSGLSVSLVNPKEVRFLQDVEKVAKCQVTKKDLPTSAEVYANKYEQIKTEALAVKDEQCLSYIRDMEKDELIKLASGLLKITFDREIGADFSVDVTVKTKQKNLTSKDKTRVFLTIGKMDKLKNGSLLDLLKKETNIAKENFSNIEILNKFTFLDVDNKVIDKLKKGLTNKKFRGRKINVEIANRGR